MELCSLIGLDIEYEFDTLDALINGLSLVFPIFLTECKSKGEIEDVVGTILNFESTLLATNGIKFEKRELINGKVFHLSCFIKGLSKLDNKLIHDDLAIKIIQNHLDNIQKLDFNIFTFSRPPINTEQPKKSPSPVVKTEKPPKERGAESCFTHSLAAVYLFLCSQNENRELMCRVEREVLWGRFLEAETDSLFFFVCELMCLFSSGKSIPENIRLIFVDFRKQTS